MELLMKIKKKKSNISLLFSMIHITIRWPYWNTLLYKIVHKSIFGCCIIQIFIITERNVHHFHRIAINFDFAVARRRKTRAIVDSPESESSSCILFCLKLCFFLLCPLIIQARRRANGPALLIQLTAFFSPINLSPPFFHVCSSSPFSSRLINAPKDTIRRTQRYGCFLPFPYRISW